MDDISVKELAAAIIKQAVSDYESLLKNRKTYRQVNRGKNEAFDLYEKRKAKRWQDDVALLEEFFLSDWFQTLCSEKIDGELVIKHIREGSEREE